MKAIALVVLMSVVACPFAHGQDSFLFKTLYGGSPLEFFGRSVCSAGDVNGDGIGDIAIGNALGVGQVKIFAGPFLVPIMTLVSNSPLQNFGVSMCSIGDFNGDGCDDMLVGQPGSITNTNVMGRAAIYSGSTGQPIFSFVGTTAGDQFGRYVTALGDVNNDGARDFMIGAPEDSSTLSRAGRANVYSGATGTLLYSISGTAAFARAAVGGRLGDLNGDGHAEFAVGAPTESAPTTSNSGVVRVHSGINGSVLLTIAGSVVGENLGSQISGLGDVNMDGIPDIAIAAQDFTQPGGEGKVGVYSGANGSPLWNHTGLGGASFTVNRLHSIVNVGDQNGDGKHDVLVAGRTVLSDGSAYIADGATGVGLFAFDAITRPDGSTDGLRGAVANAGDVNGDGENDFLLADSLGSNTNRGTVRVAFGETPQSTIFGTPPAANVTMQLTWTPGPPVFNSPFTFGPPESGDIFCSGATPGATCLAAVSLAPTNISVFGIDVLVSFDPLHLIFSATMGASATGVMGADDLDISNPYLAGSAAYIQFFEVSPVVRASNGVRVIFMP